MSEGGIATIQVPVLLAAYRQGMFPMCHEDGELYWHDPDPRAIFPLDRIIPNARMRRLIRSGRFTCTRDAAFEAVIAACADRPGTWIDARLMASYVALHAAGHAHSVEVWEHDELVGGIYGVALGGCFFGESMFSRESNAGKVAFHGLVEHLKEQGFTLFDTQYINAFTAQLGAVEVERVAFRRSLYPALSTPAYF